MEVAKALGGSFKLVTPVPKPVVAILFVCLVFNGTFSTNRLYRAIGVGKYITQGQETTQTHNKTMKQYNKPRKSKTLFGLGFLETIPSPRLGFRRGVFLGNHLASTDNLARTTKRQNI